MKTKTWTIEVVKRGQTIEVLPVAKVAAPGKPVVSYAQALDKAAQFEHELVHGYLTVQHGRVVPIQ